MNIKAYNADKTFIIDDEDAERVLKYKWYCNIAGYYKARDIKNQIDIFLHKFILNLHLNKNVMVDHINRVKDDNRRSNLRACSRSENLCNATKCSTMNGKHPSSKYKGVSFNKQKQKWQVKIEKDKKYYLGGSYKSEQKAALAANELIKQHHGEFARLNQIP